jgi:hypothetical protein
MGFQILLPLITLLINNNKLCSIKNFIPLALVRRLFMQGTSPIRAMLILFPFMLPAPLYTTMPNRA